MKIKQSAVGALAALSVFAAGAAQAAVLTLTGAITDIGTYTDYGSGDVFVRLDVTATGCDAFWIRGSDVGRDSVYSFILSSYMANKSVKLYAEDGDLWGGSGLSTCRILSSWPG